MIWNCKSCGTKIMGFPSRKRIYCSRVCNGKNTGFKKILPISVSGKDQVEYKRQYYLLKREKILLYIKQWRKDNREKFNNYMRELKRGNPKYAKNQKLLFNKWRKENPTYYRDWNHKRREENVGCKISNNFANGVRSSLKSNKGGRRWEDFVGYTLQDLMGHLEKQFDKNMSWKNYGSYWWIDHKRPISSFNFSSQSDEEFKKCWSLSNLQPLEKIANIKKSNKVLIDILT